jgi:hypothetical protein
LIDSGTVVFPVFDGEGEVVERQLSTDQKTLELCLAGFEAVWQLAIEYGEYRPR